MFEYSITAIGGDHEAAVHEALTALGFSSITIKKQMPFESYLETLDTAPVAGLSDAMFCWFQSWGCNGGDVSTECCAREACNSDVPRELAKSVFSAIADYSKSRFDAARLVRDAMAKCLESPCIVEEESDEMLDCDGDCVGCKRACADRIQQK